MAYSGTTAGTTLRNPPRCIAGGGLYGRSGNSTGLSTAPSEPNAQGGSLWVYSSTNTSTQLHTSTFFTDGYYLGMRPGDFVIANSFSSAGSSVETSIGTIVTCSTDGCGLSTGSVITSSFS